MISNILVNNYLRFVLLAGRRLASTQSNVNIGDQIKILNDNKQYKKVLELFDEFNEKTIDKCSNWIIIQALKACTQICDVQRGLKIHNLISSRLKRDPYVLPSLIHFYSLIVNDQDEEAIDIFNEIRLDELHQENHSDKKMKLLSEMKSDRLESNITIYLCLIKALAKLGMLEKAESFVQQIPIFFLTDHRIQNALIHMW
ncbi:unnamed protein product, partial [Rotaria magnacalcarata]